MHSAPQKKHNIRSMTLTGLMTALLCIMAPFCIYLPFSPVPLSLATLAIYFTVMVLGGRQGFFSVLLYILLGLAGLPVFSGFTAGAGKLFGPTGGYIIGYLFIAVIHGFFMDVCRGRMLPCLAGMLIGTLVCYGFGTLWLAYQTHCGFGTALASGVLPFLPGDLLKILTALPAGRQIRSRLLQAGLLSF